MKKLLVFCGDDSYPSGGWKDFKGSFDNEIDALRFLVKESFDWYQIVDRDTGEIIDSSTPK